MSHPICSKTQFKDADPQTISDELEALDRDICSLLMAKATGEAEGNSKEVLKEKDSGDI